MVLENHIKDGSYCHIHKMANIFIASDYHFGHESMMKFTRNDGSPLRVFKDATHMNEYIVMQHNRVVSANDKIYMVGDIAMNKKYLPILHRMNGEKILIRGDHDLETADKYMAYFKDVRASHQLDGMLLTHIPIHPESLSRWKVNIHGHLHYNIVTQSGSKIPDNRYYNVSVERLEDYTPIALEDLKVQIKNRLESQV